MPESLDQAEHEAREAMQALMAAATRVQRLDLEVLTTPPMDSMAACSSPMSASPLTRPFSPDASTDQMLAGLLTKLPGVSREALLSAVEPTSFPEGANIVTQGDVGDSFYIITEGLCDVYVRDVALPSSVSRGELVTTLHAGESFGELAMLEEGSTRQATVVAKEPTDVLQLTRAQYETIIKREHEIEIRERIDFLGGIFLFRGFSRDALRKLALVMMMKRVGPNEVLVLQGEPSKGVYFIRSGTCNVVKLLTPEQLDQDERRSEERRSGASSTSSKEGSRRPSDTDDPVAISTAKAAEAAAVAAAALRGGAAECTPKTLCELHSGEYFGELGLLLESGSTASVVTSTTAEIYVLSKYDWLRQATGDHRTQMVSAMLSHAEASYEYAASLSRSLSIGLRDEFLLDVEPPSASKPEKGADPIDTKALLASQVLPLFVPSIVQATAMGLLVPVLPLRAIELFNADSVVGTVVSGRGAGLMVGGPIAGACIAALGLRNGLLAGLGLSALAAVCGALADNVWLLTATRLGAGVGLAFFQVGRQTYVAAHIPPTVRGTVASLIAGTTRLGTTIGPVAGGAVAQISGHNTSAFWLEATLFVAAAIILRTFLNVGGDSSSGAKGGSSGAGNGAATEYPGFPRSAVRLAPVLVILTFVRAARELLLPLVALQLGASVAEIGGYTAASFAIDTALVPAAGFVMDKYGRRMAGAPSLALSAVGLALLAAASSRTLVLIAALALGLGNGMSNGWVQTVGADLAPVGYRPQFLGMWNLLMGVGTAIGPTAVGLIAQVASLEIASLMAGAISLAGAAWYVWLAEETLKPSVTAVQAKASSESSGAKPRKRSAEMI